MNISTNDFELPHWAKRISTRMPDIWKRHSIDGPVCHVGSLINNENATHETAVRWRKNFSNLDNKLFVGIDIFPGVNVDVVADLCDQNFFKKQPALFRSFGLVVCRALLEHVQNPFLAAQTIEGLIRPGGHLYVDGPWVWGYHPYPDDYWRFNFSAYKLLFPNINWNQWFYSGTKSGEGIEINDIARERKIFRQLHVEGAASLITDRSYPYLNIGAVGHLKIT